MFLIVGHLDGAAALRLSDGTVHAVGDHIGVHDDHAFCVSGSTADGLDETGLAAQKTFLVGIQNGHQAHLRQVQTLAQQVDTHHHVDAAQAQVLDDLHALEGVHLVVHILDLDALFGEVVGEVLGHFLGQGGHQHPLLPGNAGVDLAQKVHHLPFHRAHRDDRVQQSGGTNDLLGHLGAVLALIFSGRSRNKDHLVELGLHFLKFEGAVIKGRRQTEPVLHQRFLAGVVAAVHGAHLRQGDMAFVHKKQKILREIIQQGRGHAARRTARQHRRVVFDTLAHAHLVEHLNVVIGALGNALGLDELALCGELLHLRVALGADLFQRGGLFLGADNVVAGREDGHMLDHVLLGAGEGVELGDAVHLVPKKLHPNGHLTHIGQVDVHRVSVDPELVADKIHVVPLVLQGHQLFAQFIPLHLHAGPQTDDHAAVVNGVAQ